MTETKPKLRVDKWLWHARLFKSRSLAGEIATSGKLRIDGEKINKASQTVSPGNVLTFPKAGYVRMIQVDAIGQRRGPAPEAAELYTDLDPPQPKPREPEDDAGKIDPGTGDITKRDRRKIAALKRSGS